MLQEIKDYLKIHIRNINISIVYISNLYIYVYIYSFCSIYIVTKLVLLNSVICLKILCYCINIAWLLVLFVNIILVYNINLEGHIYLKYNLNCFSIMYIYILKDRMYWKLLKSLMYSILKKN